MNECFQIETKDSHCCLVKRQVQKEFLNFKEFAFSKHKRIVKQRTALNTHRESNRQ